MKNIKIIVTLFVAGMMVSACVDHRETRTEIFNENTYLDKDFLTRANPNHTPAEGDVGDYGWLMGLSVTAVSVPAPISDIFPGLQGELKYVRFGFSKDTLQVIDAVVPGPYSDDGNLVDPTEAQNLAPNILQEYEGGHVDIQLRKNLDGEISNYIEEFKERNWQDRQFFRVDLENGAFSDLSKLSWYYDYSVSPAMTLVSTSLVPGSLRYVDTVANESNFEGEVDWDNGDYLEWKTRLVYSVDVRYGNLMNFRLETSTQTVDIKYSLWRRPDLDESADEYVPRAIGEKDPYRRKFGIWDTLLHNYQDPETGFIGATKMLSRYNPALPIHFYLKDVPKEYTEPHALDPKTGETRRPLHDSVADYANEVFEMAGVKARVMFHTPDADGNYEDGIDRDFGDIRYSFVVWHNNAFTDIPWLGYGPSWSSPLTGEIVNATLNFNNWQGLHYYTYVVKDLLEKTSNAFDDSSGSCTPHELRPILDETVKADLRNTTMFSKMVSYMDGKQPSEWIPKHTEDWYDYYQMLLLDLRFYYPPYQTFVYSGRESGVANLRDMREELMEKDKDFWDIAGRLDSIESPWGTGDFNSPAGIEAGIEFINKSKESMQAHQKLQVDRATAAGINGICLMDGPQLLSSIEDISQRCKADGTWQTFEEWEDDIRWRIAHQTSIHELGHNIGQWHNFYGSVDAKHYQPCTGCEGTKTAGSSSVMDYVHHFAEVGADLGYYPYDKATIIYGYRYDSQEEVAKETDSEIVAMLHPEWHQAALGDDMGKCLADSANGFCGTTDDPKHPERAMLFANDYHRPLSPLVDTFDLGTTPSEIVYNHIQYYDWMYQFRNFRAYRQYWQTWNYPNYAFNATYLMRRFLEMWALDFNEEELENKLRILGVNADQFTFENIRDQFADELGSANRMLVNFYRAILNQSNAERSYATTYDSFNGDVTRLGIIYDKYYAMMTFLGLWGADMYNWDEYALLAYYESSWGNSQFLSDAMKTTIDMLGGAYDVYPWFLPTAVLLFAQDTHDINFGDASLKEWIGVRAFDRTADMVEYFGFDPTTECIEPDGTIIANCGTAALGSQDDGHQTFRSKDGGDWVYFFLWDRNQHLCVSEDMSPASHKLIWDQNEDININNYDWVNTNTIKYFIDYYEYFN